MSKVFLGLMSQFTPSLALDFTKGVMPSGLTFTRTSIATRFNSAGVMETLAANVPRIDYAPVTLSCLGLLVEEQRTNLLLRSPFVGGGSPAGIPVNWGVSGVSSAAMTLVDGGYLGGKILRVRRDSGGWQGVQQAVNVTTGSQYPISVYVRIPTGLTPVTLSVQATAGAGVTLATAAALNAQPKDTWVRYSAVYTAISTGSVTFSFVTATGGSDGTEGFDLQCPQIERGAFASSFIPTTTVVGTREWENPIITIGTNSTWFNQKEFSIILETYITKFSSGSAGFGQSVLTIGSTFYLNQISSTGVFFYSSASGNTGAVPYSFNQAQRFALGFRKGEKIRLTSSGGTSQSSGILPNDATTYTSMRLGSYQNGDQQFNNYIRKFIVYPRFLSSQMLQSLITI